jgi:hypothetical protein
MRFTFVILLFCGLGADAQMIIKAHANYKPFAQPAANLLLDDYPNAGVAYSLRKIDKDYTGSAIRVRRSNDNAEQDIGFTSAGDLDTASLKTFVGAGNNGFVTVWYSQADSAGIFGTKNATQTTAANQPRIVNAGTVERANGKPSIRFISHLMRVTYTNFHLIDTLRTFNVVTPTLAAAADVSSEMLWGYHGGGSDNNAANRGISWGATTALLSGDRFGMSFSNAAINQGRLAQSNYTRAANTIVLHETINRNPPSGQAGTLWYLNNDATNRSFNLNFPIPDFTTAINTAPSNTGTTNTNFWIKSVQGNTNAIELRYSELIIYTILNTGGVANRSGIQNNINSYYSIW